MCGQARLEDEIAVGGNTIRVWGGGIYETETFYRTADRLGLIILQDGSFFGSCKLQIMPRPCRHDCHASDVMHRPRQIRRSINTRTRRLRPTWRTWPSRTWLRERSRTRRGGCRHTLRSASTAASEYSTAQQQRRSRLSKSKTRVWCCDSNESPDFANLQLFVATQLGTMQQENANAVLLPSCPSAGWATLEPLTPRPGYQWDPVRFDVLPSFRHLCARSHGFVVRAGRVSHG